MRKIIKIGLLLIMLLVVGRTFDLACAQTPSQSIEIAQPAIQNLSIDSKTYSAGATVNGKFEVLNSSSVDFTNVYYRVLLVGKYDAHGIAQVIYDQTAAKGPYFVKSGQTLPVTFSYALAQTVSDNNVGVQVQLVSQGGQLYGWADAHFSLSGAAQSIVVNTLSLKIGNQYIKPTAGPTIYTGDAIDIVAQITNPLKNTLKLSPRIIVYNRVINSTPLFSTTTAPLSLAYNKEVSYSFELPNFNYAPGVYAGTIDFVDASGAVRSPLSEFKYIVGGDIATIQSVTFDPQSVSKGQSVTTSVLYSGMPYDILTFKRSNMGTADLAVSLYNQKGELVGNSSTTIDLAVDSATKNVTMIANAAATALKASVTISKDGVILSRLSTNLNPAPAGKNNQNGSTGSSDSNNDLLLTGFGFLVLIVAIIVLVFIKTGRKKTRTFWPVIIFFFFVAAGCLIMPSSIKASTWYQTGSYSDFPVASDVLSSSGITVNVSPTSNNLTAGQQFQLAFSVNALACTNANDTAKVDVNYLSTSTPTQTYTQGNGYVSCNGNCISATTTGSAAVDKVYVMNQIYAGTYTAPSTPGTYKIYFKITNTWTGAWGTGSIWYAGYVNITVAANPIGSLDSADCNTISGWACDADSYATPMPVNLLDGQNYIGQYTAGDRIPSLALACGGNSYHAFNIATPNSLKDNTTHYLNVVAVNQGGGVSQLLPGSPKSINCMPSSTTTLSVSCTTDSPTSVLPNIPVTYTAHPAGGNGVYTYSWWGDNLNSASSSVSASYDILGSKIATVTVMSGGTTTTSGNCGVTVIASTTPLSVSCSTASSVYLVGDLVTYTANAIGGPGGNTYQWSGSDNGGGQVGYWSMNSAYINGSSITDQSGTGNDGSITNSPPSVTGKIAQALLFNGFNQYITIPNNSSLNSTTGTWSVWVKDTAVSSGSPYNILSKEDSSSSVNGLSVYEYQGVFGVQFKNASAVTATINGGSAADLNWHHLVVTFTSGGPAIFYVDGNPVGNTTIPTFTFSTNPLNIAHSSDSFWADYKGAIDEVQIFNRVLSPSEVIQLYNTGVVNNALTDSGTQYETVSYTTPGPKSATVVVDNGMDIRTGTSNITVNGPSSPGTPTLTFKGNFGSTFNFSNITISATTTPYTLNWTLSPPSTIIGSNNYTCTASGSGWNGDKTPVYGSPGRSQSFVPNSPGSYVYYLTCVANAGVWSGTVPYQTVVVQVMPNLTTDASQCYASVGGTPNVSSAKVGDNVVWTVGQRDTDGSMYGWSSPDLLVPYVSNFTTYKMNYSTIGQKLMTLTVYDTKGNVVHQGPCQASNLPGSPLIIVNMPKYNQF